ncbi:hypothetical protein MKW98_020986 [Papaver atlanticum]|uniref:DNA (cytosine-5-)-methyltransferase n=1 Tax=Papaver atlanticum TaxID=357466 RepID=A0AAD4SM72_9MAGN|nr:hypothetical protein MKW98_020986 [Papaver atlanticum]
MFMSMTDSDDSSWDIPEEDEPAACLSFSRWRMTPCRRGGGRTTYLLNFTGKYIKPSWSDAIDQFKAMGFDGNLVIKTIDEIGEENTEKLLETLLTYKNIEEFSPRGVLSRPNSTDTEWDSLGDLSDFSDKECCMQNEVNLEFLPEETMMRLVAMGYCINDVSRAINSCGPDTSISVLVDYIFAAQLAEPIPDHPCERPLQGPDVKKKKQLVEQEYEEMMSDWGSHRGVLPRTSRFWPSWDTRCQFNCLRTRTRTRSGGDPPQHIQKKVLKHCRNWNFVWTGNGNVAPFSPEEIEEILGYPNYHTRRGATHAQRYETLGNSFQSTVVFLINITLIGKHRGLSSICVEERFAKGIKVLSLFSGIGGAEIALDRLRIPLRLVVAVKISEINRDILRGWWNDTRQTGIIDDHIPDVKLLAYKELEKLVNKYGGFDLVIGGSPCNNIIGSNRWHRVGLEGAHSVLFYDYCRIQVSVIPLMRENMLY